MEEQKYRRVSIPIYRKIWVEGEIYRDEEGALKANVRLMAHDKGETKILREDRWRRQHDIDAFWQFQSRATSMSVGIYVEKEDGTTEPFALIDEYGMDLNRMDGIKVNDQPGRNDAVVEIDIKMLPHDVKKVLLV